MFNERIKELRLSLGINQVEFGKKLNVSKQCVSNWENDNIQPSIDMLIRICNTFSVTADYLLGIEYSESVDISDLTEEEKKIIFSLLTYFSNKNEACDMQ